MTVLIVSSLDDLHARTVIQELAARGEHVELLDLSEFPTRLALSMAFEDGARRFVLNRTGGGRLDLSTIRSVWWRRPQPFHLPDSVSDRTHRLFAMSEAETAFHGLFRALDAFWVNDAVSDAAAHHKPWQLAEAQQAGFAIPVTLMTNNPEEARAFWREHEGNVVYKTFRALPDAWRETRRLRPEEAELAEAVSVAPVIFQRYVDAVADIRATVIGDEVFAASAEMSRAAYPVDVRFNSDLEYKEHDLPPAVQESLHSLMHRLDLDYGAIDLRLTPDGSYVFLEINPSGQFLWIELATGQKIAGALAARLATGRRTAPSGNRQNRS